MPRPRIFEKDVFRLARALPRRMPEPFAALEEYDRTHKLRRWDNKVRVNFTLNPVVYKKFRSYCQKNGYKMSTAVERMIEKSLKR